MLVYFTDSDTDMTPEAAERLGYKLISMPYSIDGKNIYPYVDFDKFDPKNFYDMLRGGVIPKTSSLNTTEYFEYFEPVFAAGDDIAYVHFTRSLSSTFSAMDIAVAELLEKYPERKFYKIDTKTISIGSLNMALEIADMRKAGRSIDEIVKWAEEEAQHFAVYFFADDLRFFKQSGRVSNLAGTMGTLLGLRPIIYINDEGKMLSIGKEKGRIRAIEHLVNKVEELGEDVKAHRILIVHSDALDIANKTAELLRARLGDDLNIEIWNINPTVGCHCGPNAIGVCFHAKHR